MFTTKEKFYLLPEGVIMKAMNVDNTTASEVYDFVQKNKDRFADATNVTDYTEEMFRAMLYFTTNTNTFYHLVTGKHFFGMYRLEKDGQLVGWVSVSNIIGQFIVKPYFSYLLDESVEGKGVMKAATRLVLEIVTKMVPIKNIDAYVRDNNERSVGLLKTLGFQDTERDTVIFDSKELSIFSLDLTAQKFSA